MSADVLDSSLQLKAFWNVFWKMSPILFETDAFFQ